MLGLTLASGFGVSPRVEAMQREIGGSVASLPESDPAPRVVLPAARPVQPAAERDAGRRAPPRLFWESRDIDVHGADNHPHPRRRHRPRSDGCRGQGSRRQRLRAGLGDVLGGGASREGTRHDPAAGPARLGHPQQGGAERPDHDAGGQGIHQRQRRAAQGARPLREPAAGLEPALRALALHRRRSRDRPREHRRPVCRPRARGRARRGGEPEDHHGEGIDADRRIRVPVRAHAWPPRGHGRPQGQHHEAQRRPFPGERAHGRGALSGRRSSTIASWTRPACTW